jgi:clan AA aspartic protease
MIRVRPMPSFREPQHFPNRMIAQKVMGEVRVKVTLTNAVDEVLARRGQLPAGEIRRSVADALVDTGAVSTVIPPFVFERLGLATRKKRIAVVADGRKLNLDASDPVLIEIFGRDTTEETLVLRDEVLIGQTVLEKTDLLVDCANQCVVPNPAHPDQPIIKIK